MADTQASRAVVESWYTALAAGNMEGVVGALAEDILVHVGGTTPISGTCRGRDVFVNEVIGPLFAQLDPQSINFAKKWEIFCADGERVVTMMEGSATSLTGIAYDNTYCHLFRVDDGQIVELWEFLDTALLAAVTAPLAAASA
jgi:hypothetical protein